MDTLILEDFRCFAGRREVPIRPLTLLVGENSTGKTSFLAAVRAAHGLQAGAAPDFNEEPFRLGSYDQIATHRGRPAQSFALGFGFALDPPGSGRYSARVESRFTSRDAQPGISEFHASTGVHTFTLKDLDTDAPEMLCSVGDETVLEQRIGDDASGQSALRGDRLQSALTRALMSDQGSNGARWHEHRDAFMSLLSRGIEEPFDRPRAFAPIRTSPQRTYDPTAEPRRPDGRHIPVSLAMWLGGDNKLYSKELNEFGQEGGLYSNLGIRRLGRRGSDPFQIKVTPIDGGTARNLIDVGYGVSHAIPIIADCLSAPMATLLIQQPEVHLHPRAQAAMGSFFAQLAMQRPVPVVVETHSDYLVDRVRMDVRDEKLKPSDVMILYFEQGRRGAEIHPIELDAAGRVVEAPPGYRSFFLQEQRRFFGVD